MTVASRVGRSLFWFFCLAVPAGVIGVMVWGGIGFYQNMAHHLPDRAAVLATHIAMASVALAIVPFQFWRRLRNRHRGLHRWMGRTYGVAVLLGGVSGFVLAVNAVAGPLAVSGFATLAVVWIGTTAAAIQAARTGNIARHQSLMAYSAALSFAAVTLRIQLPMIFVFGLSFDAIYPVIAWTCWVPNVLAVYLWRRRRPAALLAA